MIFAAATLVGTNPATWGPPLATAAVSATCFPIAAAAGIASAATLGAVFAYRAFKQKKVAAIDPQPLYIEDVRRSIGLQPLCIECDFVLSGENCINKHCLAFRLLPS